MADSGGARCFINGDDFAIYLITLARRSGFATGRAHKTEREPEYYERENLTEPVIHLFHDSLIAD
jgi:hypothetical protein